MTGVAFAEFEVVAPIHRGDDLPPVVLEATVREPSVAEALAVLSGDDAEALRAARTWLPPRLYSDCRALSPEARGVLLARILAHATGADEAKTRKDTGTEATTDALEAAVLDAALSLGSYEAAVSMPWGAFLRLGDRIRIQKAARALEAATAARVGHHADKRGWKDYEGAIQRIISPRKKARALSEAEKAAAQAQAEHVREQIRRRRERGSMLAQTDEERRQDAERLAAMQATQPEAKA